jgi:hypothetical protein
MRKEQITGFTGKVDHLELQHIIQIACLAGITATILVRQGNQKGYLNPTPLNPISEVPYDKVLI